MFYQSEGRNGLWHSWVHESTRGCSQARRCSSSRHLFHNRCRGDLTMGNLYYKRWEMLWELLEFDDNSNIVFSFYVGCRSSLVVLLSKQLRFSTPFALGVFKSFTLLAPVAGARNNFLCSSEQAICLCLCTCPCRARARQRRKPGLRTACEMQPRVFRWGRHGIKNIKQRACVMKAVNATIKPT